MVNYYNLPRLHHLYSIYPLVNVYITMERSTIFNGKIHYFDWAIFNRYVTNYQRVYPINIPLNPIKPPFSYGFPMVFLWFSYGFPMGSPSDLSETRHHHQTAQDSVLGIAEADLSPWGPRRGVLWLENPSVITGLMVV